MKKFKTNKKLFRIIIIILLIIAATFLMFSTNLIKKIDKEKLKNAKAEIEQQTVVPDGYTGIYSREDLEAINDNLSGKYILMADIDLSEENWTPIANGTSSSQYFTGTLDGNNYKISNLKIESDESYVGMFGYINGGIIKNLTLENINVKATNTTSYLYVGGLAGQVNNGTIQNIKEEGNNVVTTELTSKSVYIGGLIGYASGTCENIEINNIQVTGNTTGTLNIGGLVGHSNSTITNGVVQGDSIIESTDTSGSKKIGGLIGYQSNKVTTKSHTEAEIIARGTRSNIGRRVSRRCLY